MALQSKTIIIINGQEFSNFQFLKLHQEVSDRDIGNKIDELTLVLRMDTLETSEQELVTNSKEFLGEVITIETMAKEGFEGTSGALTFKGIITEIKPVKGHKSGDGDKIVITAKSPDFITHDGPHFASHNESSLSDVLTKTFEGYDASKLEVAIQPENDITLDYSVQHNESSYDYASRLAAQYGEWLYYDGEKLIFGTPSTEELELTYGFDLKEYQLSLLPQSNNYKIFANDYLTDEVQQKATSETDAGLSGFGSFVSQKSGAIYTKETKIWHNLYSDSQVQQRLDTAVEKQKKAIEVKQVKINGTCDNPGVKIGGLVVVEGNKYRVTQVTHTNNEVGDYLNQFEAITADIDVYPYTNINAFPKSETQTAIVKENADPEGLGRIKVQFPWQLEKNELTPWVRVVTPHAGANKGFHFIPEVGEQVLVGFEGGNAEHPYILGVLYTGKAKPEEFKTDTNDVKIIRTRSGHTIELNDKEGEEKINIYDKDGSTITFDTQKKSLYITATENIEMQAKNIKMVAQENIELQAQGKIKTASEKITSIISKEKATLQSQKDILIKSKGKTTVNATKDAIFKGKNAIVQGQASAELKGQQTKVQGQTTNVQGASGKVNIT